jgi:gliding motility-associated-like protein
MMNMLRIYLLLFIITTANSFAQTTCTTSAAFCANNTTGSTFPAGVNNGSAAAGPDYGCLLTTPNPAWYYFQVSSSGTIIIGIAGTGGLDVDFICWGPFTSPNGNCGNLTAGNTVDCSYSSSATETCTINNAIAGQYYTLLLTNFANQAQNINFNQVGGSGSTNCSLIAPVTSATICAGQSATISANTNLTNPTFLWSPGGLTTQTIVVSPISTTIYSVTVNGLNASNTPTTITGSGTVTVSSPPSVAITPASSSICLGQSIGLSSSGPGPFVWTASSGAPPSAAANVTVTPNITTTYTVVSGVGSCTSSAIATVSITTSPSISITPSLSAVCLGQSIGLSVSGAGPFVWTASVGAAPSAAANVTVTPSSTTSYTVISGVGSCTSSAVATVSITTSPSISITPSLSTICAGQSIGLSVSGTGPYVWTASSGPNPASAANVTVTPSSTTSYTVISGVGTCTSTAVATVSLSVIPVISITPSLTTICVGQNVVLSSTGAGPYNWTASSGANPLGVATITVNPTITTTYTVLSGSGTCTAQAVATVSIGIIPAIAITPSNTTICLGASTSLSASGSGPFVWTASSGSNPASAANITVTPNSTTTYTVLSGTGACTTTAIATVSIAPTLPISITPSNTIICLGANTNLATSGIGPYTWTASSGANPGSSSSVIVAPIVNTTYTVLSGTGACTAQAVATVSIAPALTVTIINSNSVICSGQTSNLTCSGAGPFNWTASVGLNPNPLSTVIVNPTSSTTYTVLAGTGACTAQAVSTVNVLPTINPTLIAASNTVCITNSVIISAPIGTGLTYSWQPSAAISGSNNTSSIVAVPPSTSTVIYTVTISNGLCSDSDTIQLKVKTPPSINSVTTLNNDTICVGGCVTFSVNSSGTSPIYYQWYYETGIGTSSVGIAPEACYPSAGVFSVIATASNVCGFDTLVKNNFITVFDMPVLNTFGDTTINIGETASIMATGGLNYNWTPDINNSIACATCSNTIVQPLVSTNYVVVASNSQYCVVQDTVKIIVDVDCGDFFIPNVFSPNDDGLNDLINVHGRCISNFNLQIFSRWGEKVFETSTLENSWDGTYKGKKMDTGVFVYKADGVSIDGQSFRFKGNITLIR